MKIQIGLRHHGLRTWYKYLIPHNITPKEHEYFQWFYWWLCFYICKARRCDHCGKVMPSCGGVVQWDESGNHAYGVLCADCVIAGHGNSKFTQGYYKRRCEECGKCKHEATA